VVFQIGETVTRAEQKAFTLIELLVVITVIGILASLLLPTLARAKVAARATECRNNLRTMALAMRLYVDEYNVYLTRKDRGMR
jgi:prepilin-type N-terminal cleavage/methylation domain-containing protein